MQVYDKDNKMRVEYNEWCYINDRLPKRGDWIAIQEKFESRDTWLAACVTDVDYHNENECEVVCDVHTNNITKASFDVRKGEKRVLKNDTYGSSGKKKWYYPTEKKLGNIRMSLSWKRKEEEKGERSVKEAEPEPEQEEKSGDDTEEPEVIDDLPSTSTKQTAEMRMIYAKMEEMQKALERVKGGKRERSVENVALTEYPGVMLQYHLENFRALKDKSMYLEGFNMTGVRDPTNKGRIMCAYNKNLVKICISKEKKEVEGEKGVKWISGMASFVDIGLFGEPLIRGKASGKMAEVLRHHALCKGCRDSYGNHMMDLVKKGQCCAVCRVSYGVRQNALTMGSNPFAFCAGCHSVLTNVGNGMSDEIVKLMLMPLGRVFGKRLRNFDVVANRPVATGDESRLRTPDVVMHFDDDVTGLHGIVVVENDPGHGKNKEDDEHKKMVTQLVPILRRFKAGTGKGVVAKNEFKMLIVRFNPVDKYQKGGDEYHSIERLVILRRWVIWWLMHLEDVRNLSMFYMFYPRDGLVGRKMLWEGSEFTSGLWEAPRPSLSEGKSDWAYCLDHFEINGNKSRDTGKTPYDKVNEGSMEVKEQFNRAYVMLQSAQKMVLPSDLVERLIK